MSACERLASRDAAAVFSVSLHDQERFDANGIPTRVIPHGMETEPALPRVDAGQIPPELQRLQAAGSTGRPFVSSLGAAFAAILRQSRRFERSRRHWPIEAISGLSSQVLACPKATTAIRSLLLDQSRRLYCCGSINLLTSSLHL